jgi:hypothetical protein
MALSDDSLPSKALLFALLAVSSQYRDGLQSQAVQFKLSAISALAKSAKNGSLGTTDAAQHVATGMLLCSFEVSSNAMSTDKLGMLNYLRSNHVRKQMENGYGISVV